MLPASGLPYFSSALCYWLVSTGPGWQTKGESQFVHTSLLALVKTSLVRRLLDVLVNVGSSNQLFGPVPHRQPRCRVIKKHPVITCPYYTPDTGQQNKHTFKSTNRMKGTELTQQMCCFEQRWRRLTMACQGSDLWRWAELSELPSPPLSSLLLSAPVWIKHLFLSLRQFGQEHRLSNLTFYRPPLRYLRFHFCSPHLPSPSPRPPPGPDAPWAFLLLSLNQKKGTNKCIFFFKP